MTETRPPLMEVTQAVLDCARAAHFELGEGTAIVAVQHMLWQTVDLFRAVLDMGLRPENIFALGKVYSNSIPVIQTLREMGVVVTESTMPGPGEFNEYFERDVKHLWEVVEDGVAQRQIKRIIVLDDAGKCIANTPSKLLRRYSIGGVEQTSVGMFVFEEKPPAFAVTSWARAAVKLQIGGPIFSHCLLEKLNTEFLRGELPQNQEIGIIGMGSIGKGMADLAARDGHNLMFYDPNPNLETPQYLKNRVTRLDSLQQLMTHCDYVLGCSGRNPFKDKWPMKYRPGIKLFSGSSGDDEFGPIIRDLKGRANFKVASDTWDITCDDGPSGPILIAYHGYPYNFVSRGGEAVPTQIVQLETGGLLAGLMQTRSHLALYENGQAQNKGIQRMSPEAQRFVYETWLRTMRDQGINVRERYGYDPAVLRAAQHNRWFVDNSGPNPAGAFEPKSSIEVVMRDIFDNITTYLTLGPDWEPKPNLCSL
jgi:D-isomer specific 2-hydroxyacid dehydrogenase-like protein